VPGRGAFRLFIPGERNDNKVNTTGKPEGEFMATFLLVHGAYQGSWIWKLIAQRLQAQGHTVYAPSLDGCGERAHQLRAGITTETHADEMIQFLSYHDLHDVIVVGTSSGGMVMARMAELAPERFQRLVFADALMLMDGEKIRDIVTQPAAINTELALGPGKENAESRLLAGLEPHMRGWAAERFTLHPQAVFNQPVKLERFWEMPWRASVLYCSGAANPGEKHLRRGAEKLGAAWHRIDTGHYPMLSTPDELVSVILAE
jgi:pimeloyl-ACP methyl ester carboxylesterase